MKQRTRRDHRSAKDSVSLFSCVQGYLLCRGGPPTSSPPPPVLQSSPPGTAAISTAELTRVELPSPERGSTSNGGSANDVVELPGGNRLQRYDRLIATLLRERSLVKNGTAWNGSDRTKLPPTQTAHSRLTAEGDYALKIDRRIGFPDTSSKLVEDATITIISKPADNDNQTSSLKSVGRGCSAAVSRPPNNLALSANGHQLRDPCAHSAVESKMVEVPQVETVECSSRRRRRRRRVRKVQQGGDSTRETETVGCLSADCVTIPLRDRVAATQRSTEALSFDDSELQLQPEADRQKSNCGAPCQNLDGFEASSDPQARGNVNARNAAAAMSQESDHHLSKPTDAGRHPAGSRLDDILLSGLQSIDFDVTAMTLQKRVHLDLSKKCTTTVLEETEPQSDADMEFDKLNVCALTVDISTIEFIDCDCNEHFSSVEEETACLDQVARAKTNLPTENRQKITDNELSASSQVGCWQSSRQVSEPQCVRTGVQARECDIFCRRLSSSFNGDWPSSPGHLSCRRCQSKQSFGFRNATQFRKTTGQRAPHPSRPLMSCRCSISWSFVAEKSEDENGRSASHSDVALAANMSTAREQLRNMNLQLSSVADATLPTNNVFRFISPKSRKDRASGIAVASRRPAVHHVVGRLRQRRDDRRRGSKLSTCAIRVEMMLNCLQMRHETTTIFGFVQRNPVADAAEHVDEVATGDAAYCSGRCATSDVRNDSSGYVINEQTTVQNCTAVDSRLCSPPIAVAQCVRESGVDTGDVISREVNDASMSLTTYEYAEVMSVFRRFADDLLPFNTALSTQYTTVSASTALVRRAGPGITYSGALMPYAAPSTAIFPLPLMTWTWNHASNTGSCPRATSGDVIHIPYVSACKIVAVEPSIDYFRVLSASPPPPSICYDTGRQILR